MSVKTQHKSHFCNSSFKYLGGTYVFTQHFCPDETKLCFIGAAMTGAEIVSMAAAIVSAIYGAPAAVAAFRSAGLAKATPAASEEAERRAALRVVGAKTDNLLQPYNLQLK